MQIITDKIPLDELKKMSDKMYNRLVKAVIDIEKKYMIVDMEMHADRRNGIIGRRLATGKFMGN